MKLIDILHYLRENMDKDTMSSKIKNNAIKALRRPDNMIDKKALKTAFIASNNMVNNNGDRLLKCLEDANISKSKNQSVITELQSLITNGSESTQLEEILCLLIENRKNNSYLSIDSLYNVASPVNLYDLISSYATSVLSKQNMTLERFDIKAISNVRGNGTTKSGRWEVLLALLAPEGKLGKVSNSENNGGDITIQNARIEVKGANGHISDSKMLRGGTDINMEVRSAIKALLDVIKKSTKNVQPKQLDEIIGKYYNDTKLLALDTKNKKTVTQTFIAIISDIAKLTESIDKASIFNQLIDTYSTILSIHISTSNYNQIKEEYKRALKQAIFPDLDTMIQMGDMFTKDNFLVLLRRLVTIDAKLYKSISGFDYLMMINDSGKSLMLTLEEDNTDSVLAKAGFKAISARVTGNINTMSCAWGLILE